MLGRKNDTQQEVDHARAAVEEQLAAYTTLITAYASEKTNEQGHPARDDCEEELFNNMTLVLDRYFVHRVRLVAEKDGNPLNEVELMCDSLMNNDGILRGNNVMKYVRAESVVKVDIGQRIRLTSEEFERLSAAFFVELERRFLSS